jgi:hypothetical protein
VAQYRITDGGRVVDLLLPPAGLAALRAPATFAKIDSEAAHRLPPHARTLYGLLADRNRQTNRRWRVEVDDLKIRLGVPGRYKGRFNDFRRWVLDPAVSAINDFGVIFIEKPLLLERLGRQVHAVVFVWNLKDFPSAAKTAGEADRHSIAAGKHQDSVDAPPLTGSAPERDASAGQHRPLPFLRWRDGLPPDERKAMATKYALGPRGHRLADHPGLWQDAWDGEGRPAPSAATER